MIIVITENEFLPNRNCYVEMVSHGVNSKTMRYVVLPNVPIDELGVKWNSELQQFVLDEDDV